MTEWTAEELLRFYIAFALKKVTIPGFRKALTEDQRIAIAGTILEHLKLCRWTASAPTPTPGLFVVRQPKAEEQKA